MFSSQTPLKVLELSQFKEFDAPGEAIGHGQQLRKDPGHLTINKEVSGALISGVSWSDTDALFQLSNHKTLELTATPTGVRYQLLEGMVKISHPKKCDSVLTLQFCPDAKPYVWERSAILKQRVGRRLLHFFRNDPSVFIYTEKRPVLLFCALGIAHDDGHSLLLNWDESD